MKRLTALVGLLIVSTSIHAVQRTIDLHVGYKNVDFAGQTVRALAINNHIPAPTLHFREGDHVTINVYNHLDTGTAIHWHGLLVPWRMDGVEMVTQDPIAPGSVFHYEFTLKQSGTYWYHSHAGLQEQEGLYGALIIDPVHEHIKADKDFPIVLSDWSNTHADAIYANLKREGDYYSPNFPLQPSLSHYLRSYRRASLQDRKQLNDAYSMMQTMRMSPYDFSDVAYDAFLFNGKTNANPWKAKVKIGDIVRLRFIDAGAATLFHIKIPQAKMQVVHVQGNDIQPYTMNDFWISPGETYDVLVKIERDAPYIIYAESADTKGAAIGALVTNDNQTIDITSIKKFPEPKPVMMMHNINMPSHTGHNMASMDHSMMNMHHDEMNMFSTKIPDSKYKNLVSTVKTNNPNLPYETIQMRLSGFMDKYIWFINGEPEYRAKPITIQPGKRYRFVFINETMMHHPMHLHGHWMILRNGHGEYDPRLHTIDVAPNETLTADFDTDAKDGLWYMHCHILYHMRAGMARVFRYDNTASTSMELTHAMPAHASSHDHHMTMSPHDNASIPTAHPAQWNRATFLDIGADPFDGFYQATFKTLLGPDYNKLELFMNEGEFKSESIENADMDIFYWHFIDQFWAVKGGVNYFYRPAHTPYWQPGIGLEGLAPYFIDTDLRLYDHSGSIKLDAEISRDTQLTDNFILRLELRSIFASKTVSRDLIGSGFNELLFSVIPYYRLQPGLSIFAEYEREQYFGVANSLFRQSGDAVISNTLSAGLMVTM